MTNPKTEIDALEHFGSFFVEVEEGSDEATHVQFTPYKELILKNSEDFYREYCDIMVHYQDQDGYCDYPKLGTLYKKTTPLIVPIRLEVPGECPSIDVEMFIKAVVKITQENIQKQFILSPTKNEITPELICCVLEGPDLFIGGKTISYSILHFPNLRTESSYIKDTFFPLLHKALKESGVLDYLDPDVRKDIQPSWTEIIPVQELTAIPLYLSVKDLSTPAVELSHIYPDLVGYEDLAKFNEEEDEVAVNSIFTPERHSYFHKRDGEILKELNHYYPLFFDVFYQRFSTPLVVTGESVPKTPAPAKKTNKVGKYRRGNELDIAKKMLQILKQDVSILERNISVIGRSIYGSDVNDNGRSTEEGEEIFMLVKRTIEKENFSKRRARIEYRELRRDELIYTYKTLCYIAQLNFQEDFSKWHGEWVLEAVKDCLINVNESKKLAEVVYRKLFMHFIVTDYAKNTWYYFDGITWELSDQTVEIRTHIFTEIVPLFESIRDQLKEKMENEVDSREIQQFRKDIGNVGMVLKSLGTMKGLNEIVNMLKIMFHVKFFSKKQNNNIYITGIKNGVMEATNEELFFREGFPEDFVTKRMEASYEEFNWNSPAVKFFMTWLNQIWAEEVVDFFLKYNASKFIGKNLDKMFLLILGDTGNGKSQLNYTNKCLFGEDYHADIDATAFSRKGAGSSAATPEWEDARDTRSVDINEPNEDFFSDKLKKLTGGDGIRSRNLHDKGGPLKPTFKFCIYANQPPGLEGDKAMRERVRVVECDVQYVPASEAPGTPEEQKKQKRFPMDTNFDEKIKRYINGYLWILCQYFKKYKAEGLKTPPIMKKWANSYWIKHDSIQQFKNEYISTEDFNGQPLTDEAKVSINDFYKIFASWYMELHQNKSIPSIATFSYNLKQKGVKMDEDQLNCLGVRNKKFSDI